jgi:hypothetical protein
MKKRKPRIALRSHERDALDAIASTVRREKILHENRDDDEPWTRA